MGSVGVAPALVLNVQYAFTREVFGSGKGASPKAESANRGIGMIVFSMNALAVPLSVDVIKGMVSRLSDSTRTTLFASAIAAAIFSSCDGVALGASNMRSNAT